MGPDAAHADEVGMVGRTTARSAQALPIFMSQRSRTRMPLPGVVVLVLLVAVALRVL